MTRLATLEDQRKCCLCIAIISQPLWRGSFTQYVFLPPSVNTPSSLFLHAFLLSCSLHPFSQPPPSTPPCLTLSFPDFLPPFLPPSITPSRPFTPPPMELFSCFRGARQLVSVRAGDRTILGPSARRGFLPQRPRRLA